ncbi:MAG: hypothetical protein Fur0041_02780 [Bacteroidia bacterium]
MSKKSAAKPTPKSTALVLPELNGNGWLFLKSFRFQALVVALVGVLFYVNTRNNEYALDDDIIIRQNIYVQKGFSGISEIMFNDAYKSFYEGMGVEQQLEGGRYRPLSIVTFAIEQQLFGECYGERYTEVRDSIMEIRKKQLAIPQVEGRLINERNDLELKIKASNLAVAPLRHMFQVFWFVLAMVALLWFLREHIFRSNTDLAFLSVLLFAIHPIHTEVVANVKSRDEIFSLLFISLTFIFFFRYDLNKIRKDLIYGLVAFLLALLSKEYAIALLALIPAGLMIFHKRTLTQTVSTMLPAVTVLIIYAAMRMGSIDVATGPKNKSSQDPLNDPYLYANDEQRIASKLNRLDDYLVLLVYPVTLVADYSYQHFPYSKFTDPMVWLSLLVYGGLLYLTLRLWKQRHPLSFALLIYFGFFALICNIFFDIGATMGERLIFHSSIGFCMVLAWLIIEGAKKTGNAAKLVVTGAFVLLAVPAWMITTKRNLEWKSDYTLFTADVLKHPESALCNANAGARYMDEGIAHLGKDSLKVIEYADRALPYLQKAVQLHPKYVNGYLNLGLTYYHKGQYDKAADAWSYAYRYFPSNQILQNYNQMLIQKATQYAVKKDYANASKFLGYAVTAYPGDARIWGDYAGASFMARDFATAKNAFSEAIRLKPELKPQLEAGLGAAMTNESALNAWKADTNNVDATITLGKMYMGTNEFYPESRRLLNKALTLSPNNSKAVRLLDSLSGLEAKFKASQLPK